MEARIEIKSPHLIVCEGLDAKNYMIYFLRCLIEANEQFEKFQAIDAGGNDEFPVFFKTLSKLPNFSIGNL